MMEALANCANEEVDLKLIAESNIGHAKCPIDYVGDELRILEDGVMAQIALK
jgi:hypothetical protein